MTMRPPFFTRNRLIALTVIAIVVPALNYYFFAGHYAVNLLSGVVISLIALKVVK